MLRVKTRVTRRSRASDHDFLGFTSCGEGDGTTPEVQPPRMCVCVCVQFLPVLPIPPPRLQSGPRTFAQSAREVESLGANRGSVSRPTHPGLSDPAISATKVRPCAPHQYDVFSPASSKRLPWHNSLGIESVITVLRSTRYFYSHRGRGGRRLPSPFESGRVNREAEDRVRGAVVSEKQRTARERERESAEGERRLLNLRCSQPPSARGPVTRTLPWDLPRVTLASEGFLCSTT